MTSLPQDWPSILGPDAAADFSIQRPDGMNHVTTGHPLEEVDESCSWSVVDCGLAVLHEQVLDRGRDVVLCVDVLLEAFGQIASDLEVN